MKKLIALVLALAMVALCAVASATTITINQNNTNGTAGAESYDLYKIFDVVKASGVTEPVTTGDSNGGDSGFSYTISSTSPWVAVLGSFTGDTWTSAEHQSYVTLRKIAGDSTKYTVVPTANGLDSAAEAKAFASFLENNIGSISPTETITSTNGVATYDGTDGYYLITSTLGTNLILATSDITINTKNSYPTTEKTVEHPNYNVGDKVKYTITVELPASVDYTKDVTVHDTMDAVLAVDSSSIHAKVTDDNDFDDHITYHDSDNLGSTHLAHANSSGKIQYDFILDIDSLAPGANETATAKTITITYEAELLSTAAADTEYVNKEFVEYSQYKTPEDDAKIKTFDFQLKKQFDGAANADLTATFILVTDSTDESTAIDFVTDSTGYVKADSDDTLGANPTILTVHGDTTGINVRGLKAGTYYLIEKSTADGYNLLSTPITVTISDAGVATVGSGDLFSATDSTITVNNQAGTLLPSTGGIGTTIFYILGGLLVVGAAVILVARRRVHE